MGCYGDDSDRLVCFGLGWLLLLFGCLVCILFARISFVFLCVLGVWLGFPLLI